VNAADCRNCGWRLLGGYVVGIPSAAAQQELDRAIARARRRYALRGALRAADWREPGRLAMLAALATGGTAPSEREIDDAVADRDEQEAAPPGGAGLGFTLGRLVAGDTDAVEFVEISPHGIAWQLLVADELGVPVPGLDGQVSWTGVLPGLPADDDLRTYLLAGGIRADLGGGAGLAALIEEAAGREIARLTRVMTDSLRQARDRDAAVGHDIGMVRPPLARPDTVLVLRTKRWPPLEAAAVRARAVLRPVAEIFAPGPGPLRLVLAEAVRQAPLRYDYCLVLAAVDPATGLVRPEPRPLFRAGTTGQQGSAPTVDIRVLAPSAATERVVLPVVARRGDHPSGWPAVGTGVMDGTAAGVTRLRVRLEAPGRVSMSATPRLVSGDGVPGWPSVLATLPDQLPAAVVADVVLLAELGGRPAVVEDRLSLLESVLGGLDNAGVRVAVLGYREHWDKYSIDAKTDARSLVVGCDLSDPADVRSLLAQHDLWRAVESRDRHAAPLEDALDLLGQPDWAWRPAARHLLVVRASRPPHPDRVDERGERRASPCRYGRRWQDTLSWLRQEQGIECLAVLPEKWEAGGPDEDYATLAWAEFSTSGLFYAERSPAADLLRAIGIAKADDRARLPLAVDAAEPGPQADYGREGH
jgi:hypothetical protein